MVKKIMKALLFLNGEEPKVFPDFSNYGKIYAADGAYNYLKAHNLKPDVLCGDFDSIDEFPYDVEIVRTPNQDYTDFEKALKIIESEFNSVDVYGASGKEQDHFLGNLSTALSFKNCLEVHFYDNTHRYHLLDRKTIIENKIGATVSFIPMPFARSVSLTGFEYDVLREDFEFGKFIGLRNKIKSEVAVVKFEKGDLFIFIEN